MPKTSKARLMGRHIVTHPKICHGKPTFRGTRVLVSDVLDALMPVTRLLEELGVLHTMFKIDVFMTRGRAFDRESLGRARREAFSADPKAPRVLVASAEDTVLAKLEWFRKGGEVSDRQWTDVVGVLKLGGPTLDTGYLRRWAETLNVTDLLERALAEATSPD